MTPGTIAALGIGVAYLLWGKGGLGGKPHDKVIASFSDLVIGMSWSATDGEQWTLTEADPDTGNVMICKTVDTQAGAGTLTGECQGFHFTTLQSHQDKESGILMMDGAVGSTAPQVSGMGSYPFRASAPSGMLLGPAWRSPDPWGSGGATGLQPSSYHAPAGPAQLSGGTGLPYRSNPARPGCRGLGCVR